MTNIAQSSLQYQSSVFHRSEGATNGATGDSGSTAASGADRVGNAAISEAVPLYLINTSHLEKVGYDSKQYKVKVVVSGAHVEVYEYQKAKVRGITPGKPTASKVRKGRQRQDNVFRAMKNLERTINANVGRFGQIDKFLTLTHREEIEDIDLANYLFNKAIKRMRYSFGDFKYIAVPEVQKRRAAKTGKEVIHDHLVTFGLPYVPQEEIAKAWGHGYVWVEKCDDYQDPGKYMAKYIGKDFADLRYLHRKAFFASQGLYSPVEYSGNDLQSILDDLKLDCSLTYQGEYENDALGTIRYYHYQASRSASGAQHSLWSIAPRIAEGAQEVE